MDSRNKSDQRQHSSGKHWPITKIRLSACRRLVTHIPCPTPPSTGSNQAPLYQGPGLWLEIITSHSTPISCYISGQVKKRATLVKGRQLKIQHCVDSSSAPKLVMTTYLISHQPPPGGGQEFPAGLWEHAHQLLEGAEGGGALVKVVPHLLDVLEVGGKGGIVEGIEPLPGGAALGVWQWVWSLKKSPQPQALP